MLKTEHTAQLTLFKQISHFFIFHFCAHILTLCKRVTDLEYFSSVLDFFLCLFRSMHVCFHKMIQAVLLGLILRWSIQSKESWTHMCNVRSYQWVLYAFVLTAIVQDTGPVAKCFLICVNH